MARAGAAADRAANAMSRRILVCDAGTQVQRAVSAILREVGVAVQETGTKADAGRRHPLLRLVPRHQPAPGPA